MCFLLALGRLKNKLFTRQPRQNMLNAASRVGEASQVVMNRVESEFDNDLKVCNFYDISNLFADIQLLLNYFFNMWQNFFVTSCI